jgi:sugar-specific transcriptional regulator TrmB
MLEKLRSFGLNKYEAGVYLTLLRIGSVEANVIATTSGVPIGRIYSILSSLQEKRIIHAQETRPRKFAAVEPSTALKHLLSSQSFRLQQASLRFGQIAAELESELIEIKPSPQNKQFWTAVLGSEETLDIMIEQINRVNEEMCITVGYPDFSKYILTKKQEESDVRKALLRALERGVNFRILVDKNIDCPIGNQDKTVKSIFKYLDKNLHCRVTTFTSTLFDIIDDDRVNLKISSPVNKEELFAIVHVRDKELAIGMKKHFDKMWGRAKRLKL